MNIIDININDIKEYENNPRHNENAVKPVANSIKEFGFKVPIILDKDNVIVAGHTRLKAAKQLGLEKVPCLIADDLTEEQVNAFRLADNKVGEIAEWDFTKLEEELMNINNIDMSAFNFDISVDDIVDNETINQFDVESNLEEIVEPKTKKGYIYKLGNHRLMCGSSSNRDDVNKLIGEDTIKTIFSSPPYNMNKKMYNSYEDNLASEEYIKFNLDVVNLYKEHLKGYLFWNISYNKNARWEFIDIMHRIVKNTGLLFLELIVWNKKKAMPLKGEMLKRQYEDILLVSDKDTYENEIDLYVCSKNTSKVVFNKKVQQKISNYWELTVDSNTQLNNHKACFPVELPKKAINLTTEKGDIVCDPFGGSGTTLIAAELLDRKCLMMELDPVYCDIIVKRWEELTGRKAELINEECTGTIEST